MIYVVMMTQGEYEDSYTGTVAASHDRAKAEAKVAALEAEETNLWVHARRIKAMFDAWYQVNPEPARPDNLPKVPVYKKPSPEQKLEAQKALKARTAATKEWVEQQNAWEAKAQAEVENLRKIYNITQEIEWYSLLGPGSLRMSEVSYHIEEVPEL